MRDCNGRKNDVQGMMPHRDPENHRNSPRWTIESGQVRVYILFIIFHKFTNRKGCA